MAASIQQQAVSFVFNALSLGRAAPFQFRVRPYPDSPVLLDTIAADATLQEIVSAETEVTDHPVEANGLAVDVVSDNARRRPIEVRVDGIVSDTPIRESELLAALQSVPPAFGFNLGVAGAAALDFTFQAVKREIVVNSQQAYERLRRLYDNSELVTIVTKRETFDSMMMTTLTVTRDQRTGEALRFAAAFKKVTKVSARTTLMPLLAQPAGDLGAQGTSKAPAALQTKTSSLVSGLKAAGVPLPDKPPAGWTGPRFFK